MKTIQCKVFSSSYGEHWEDYMDVPDHKLLRKLRQLRRNNPSLDFRDADEEANDEEWRMYARASAAVGMSMPRQDVDVVDEQYHNYNDIIHAGLSL